MKDLSHRHAVALKHHCRLACETIAPKFASKHKFYSIVLTVNSGYEGLEEGYGGPVWHVSVAPTNYQLPEGFLRDRAYEALEGVGRAMLGQWEEYSGYAFHLRRRLSYEEQEQVGDLVDIRGTSEQYRRWNNVRTYLPRGYEDMKD